MRAIRRGQATTEYMLLIAMLVVAVAVAAYAFVPGFTSGMNALSSDASTLFGAGTQNGSNNRR